MLTRRNLLKQSGIAALAAVSSDLFFMRAARSQAASAFDYYISPTGDDNNPGTLASPWSITALNSKMSIYSGKRIGIIGDVGGTQTPIQYGTVGGTRTTLYSIANGMGSLNTTLRVNGGSSSASTYLGSCTSAGVYKVGWAIIDLADPSSGNAPVSANAVAIGQSFYGVTPVPNPGYTTIDGLIVRNFNYAGIIFGDVQTSSLSGVIIRNCQVYNGICTTSAENPGGIFLGTTNGAQVLNCLIYNCTTSGGSFHPWGMGGITTYKASGLIVTNCTIYGCGYAIQNKDTNQYGTYSYNYLDNGSFGSAANTEQAWALKGPIPGIGQTLTVHHNIIVGNGYDGYGEDGLLVSGAATFYNNTFYTPPAVTTAAYCAWFDTISAPGSFNWYNNLVYYTAYGKNDGGQTGCLSFTPATAISASAVNYNYYGTGMQFGTLVGNLLLSAWQALGFDANSVSGGSPFSSTPAALNINSFQITGRATTAGRNGKACGALDGTGTVGCNFSAAVGTPAPAAPVLTSVS
jgi:Right handed beta helix region